MTLARSEIEIRGVCLTEEASGCTGARSTEDWSIFSEIWPRISTLHLTDTNGHLTDRFCLLRHDTLKV